MLDYAELERAHNDYRDHNHDVSEFPVSNKERDSRTVPKQPTSEEIWNKLHEGSEKLNDCTPYVRAFASTTVECQVLFAELKCNSWQCKTCGPKLKFKWYQKHVSQAEDAMHLEKITVPKSDWQAFYKRLQRAGAKYMVYKREDSLLVLHTGQFGGTKIPKEKRQAEVVKAIHETPFNRQPISQGRGWKNGAIKTANDKKGMKNWKALDTSRESTLEDVKKVIEKFGYQGRDYEIEKSSTESAKGLLVILKPEDYWKVLWALGVCARRKDEKRRRGKDELYSSAA